MKILDYCWSKITKYVFRFWQKVKQCITDNPKWMIKKMFYKFKIRFLLYLKYYLLMFRFDLGQRVTKLNCPKYLVVNLNKRNTKDLSVSKPCLIKISNSQINLNRSRNFWTNNSTSISLFYCLTSDIKATWIIIKKSSHTQRHDLDYANQQQQQLQKRTGLPSKLSSEHIFGFQKLKTIILKQRKLVL